MRYTLVFFVTLIILVASTPYRLSRRHTRWGNLPHVDGFPTMTNGGPNAQRLVNGLPPLPPTRTWNGPKRAKRSAAPGCSGAGRTISCKDANTNVFFGYLMPYSNGYYGTFTSDISSALLVQYSAGTLRASNADASNTYPYVTPTDDLTSSHLAAGNANAIGFTGSISSSTTSGELEPSDWVCDAGSGALSVNWSNMASGLSPSFFLQGTHLEYAGDPGVYQTANPGARRLTCFLQ